MEFNKPENRGGVEAIGWKRWLGWLVLGVGVLFAWSLWQGVGQIKSGYRRLDSAKEELRRKSEENAKLMEKVDEVSNPGYTEKIIRDDLKMQREGEVLVVLPDEGPDSPNKVDGEQADRLSQSIRNNWQKWWNLLR